MPVLRHPAFPQIEAEFGDDKVDEALSAGWVPVDPEADAEMTAETRWPPKG